MNEQLTPPSHSEETTHTFITHLLRSRPWVGPVLLPLFKEKPDVFTHSVRVGSLASQLAKINGMSFNDQLTLATAGVIHDLGKIGVPDEILQKETLSVHEKELISHHVRLGFNMITRKDPYIAQILVGHHEFQSNPYPRKTNRETDDEKMKSMQEILAIADQTDSLMSKRSYKEAWSLEKTQEELLKTFKNAPLVSHAVALRSTMK